MIMLTDIPLFCMSLCPKISLSYLKTYGVEQVWRLLEHSHQ